MLTVTDTAAAHLADLLDNADADEGMAVRFVRSDEGLALAVDAERPGDTTFDHEGRTVLVMDQELSDILNERTLDIEQGEEGTRLAIR